MSKYSLFKILSLSYYMSTIVKNLEFKDCLKNIKYLGLDIKEKENT